MFQIQDDDMGDLQYIQEKVEAGDYFHVILDISTPANKASFIVPNLRTAFLIEAKITMITNPGASATASSTLVSTNEQVVATLQKNINSTITEFSKAKIGVASAAIGNPIGRAASGSGFGTNAEGHFNVLGFSLVGNGVLNKIEIENTVDNGSAVAEFSGYLV